LKQAVTLGVGQFCTEPGVVVALRDDATQQFIGTASELMRSATPGALWHAGVHTSYLKGVKEVSALPGVQVASATAAPAGTQAVPTLFLADAPTFLSHHRLGEELFGPSTVVVTADSREQ